MGRAEMLRSETQGCSRFQTSEAAEGGMADKAAFSKGSPSNPGSSQPELWGHTTQEALRLLTVLTPGAGGLVQESRLHPGPHHLPAVWPLRRCCSLS